MQKILFIFVMLSMTAFGEAPANKIKAVIRNTKTADHINVAGTRLYIVPPKNFINARTYTGLQKGEKTAIIVNDMIGQNYNTNAALYTKAQFEMQGQNVFELKDIKVNGYPARYVSMQADTSTKAYVIIFGDSTFSTMIMAIYPTHDDAAGLELLNALNTIWYDKTKKTDRFETAYFTLNDKDTKFKFLEYRDNYYSFTVGGTDDKEFNYQPKLIVTQTLLEKSTTVKSIADAVISKSKEYGMRDATTKNISTDKINGYTAYKAEVYGMYQEKSGLLYLCVIQKDDMAITLQGLAYSDLENNIAAFKEIISTLKFK